MSKELFISSSPHETKVAVLEDDALVEVFYQRDTDVGLVGGIYKGRVSRVLPGMQSAFVDIGLERDAFLYVSDFFEDSDEYDRVVAEAETRVSKQAAEPAPAATQPTPGPSPSPVEAAAEPPSEAVVSLAEPEAPQPAVEQPATAPVPPPVAAGREKPGAPTRPVSSGTAGQPSSRWDESRGRGRRRRRGRGFGGKPEFREHRAPESPAAATGGIELLPGESLAKYAHIQSDSPSSVVEEPAWQTPSADDSPEPSLGSEVLAAETATATAEPEENLAAVSAPAAPEPLTAQESPEPETLASKEATEPSPDAGPDTDTSQVLLSADSPEEAASSEPSEDRLEDDLLAGNLRLARLPVEPDAPTHSLIPAAEREESMATSFEVEESALASNPSCETEESEGDSESPGDESLGEEDGEAGDSSSEAEEELEEDGGETEEETAESMAAEGEGEASQSAAAPGESGGAGDRSYTLRDSNQRPRFAPRRGRRGRGRFGRRGVRPEGQAPRRAEHPRGGNEQAVQINEVLKEGQEILVQIAKEPLGTKGARITSHIALPGRYLVYMPTIHHTGVSRKISSEEERLRLRNIILEHRGALTGGIIVRTAAAGRPEEELKADIAFLARLWNEIRTRSERSKAPALIHRDLTLVERILRDILSPDFKSVRVDNEVEYQGVLDFVNRFQPSLVGHVRLYSKDTPMFEEFGVQAEIDKALKPKVWLKSGGYIVINQTEALVAIDVNTGKYVGKTNRLEDTIVKTNIDAVKEIVRQVRLRDLGGIIVIDFIDMDDRRNRMKVVQALEEALRSDRAPTKILSFNEFGLVALTRKRVKQSLERTLSEQCPYCSGSGWIKSVTTICYEILEEARKMSEDIEGNVLTLRVNPEVARALKFREGTLTSEIASLTGKDVVIKSDPTVHQERFEIF